jgi:hypothetical protein
VYALFKEMNEMFIALTNWWANSSFWDKIQVGYLLLMVFVVTMFVWERATKNPKKCLRFITKASKDDCVAIGKLTCLTIHGYQKPEYYQAEYMYVVNDKRYFVTYQMAYIVPIDSRLDEMNADMVLLYLKGAMPLFYDKNKPSKVISKIEVFTSDDGIKQVYTPKKNAWRDINRDWTSPINLVQY